MRDSNPQHPDLESGALPIRANALCIDFIEPRSPNRICALLKTDSQAQQSVSLKAHLEDAWRGRPKSSPSANASLLLENTPVLTNNVSLLPADRRNDTRTNRTATFADREA